MYKPVMYCDTIWQRCGLKPYCSIAADVLVYDLGGHSCPVTRGQTGFAATLCSYVTPLCWCWPAFASCRWRLFTSMLPWSTWRRGNSCPVNASCICNTWTMWIHFIAVTCATSRRSAVSVGHRTGNCCIGDTLSDCQMTQCNLCIIPLKLMLVVNKIEGGFW